MSKLTWDNAALINPRTAREMGLKQGDLLNLSHGGRSLVIPAYLMPGQAIGSVTVALGYGRTHGGSVADGCGFDAYALRTSEARHFLPSAEISAAGGTYQLVTTQDHHAIKNPEQGRGQAQRLPALYREGTVEEYEHHPDFAAHRIHHPPLVGLFEEHPYEGHKWGMTIDLSACTGCGSCVMACQAENNIPVVGKKEVSMGARDGLDPGGPLLPGRSGEPVGSPSARGLPPLRERSVRAGLPRRRHDALRRGPQRHGLQPLRRHAVLPEQLPVQGPAVQLVQQPEGHGRRAQDAAQPGRHRPGRAA